MFPNFYLTASPSVPSYDWFDFVTNVGYKTFYAAATKSSTSTTYFLTPYPIDGDRQADETQAINNSVELNFDITINKPLILATADAYVSYTTTQDDTSQVYALVTIYHVSAGGTETSLGALTSDTITATIDDQHTRRTLRVALTGRSFAIGERIRLMVTLTSSGVGKTTSIYFDPNGRRTFTEYYTTATIDSSMTVTLPLKVDLNN